MQDQEFNVSLGINSAMSNSSQVILERMERVRRVRIALEKKFKVDPLNGVKISLRVMGESNAQVATFNANDSIKV